MNTVNPLTQTASFTSSKIKGAGDEDRLETQLGGLDGVRDIEVDTNAHTVVVTYDPTIVSEPALKAAVEDAGYKIDSDSQSPIT